MSVKNNSVPSLRSSLIIVIVIMGLIAVALSIITGQFYREYLVNHQRVEISRLMRLMSEDVLSDMLDDSITLGYSTNKSRNFRKALASGDRSKIRDELDNTFHQYFVTADILQLEKLYLYDLEANLITSSSEGVDTGKLDSVICGGFAQQAVSRKGAERIKPIHEYCLYDGKLYLSVIVPVGGLIPKSYLQVVINPTFSLRKIKEKLGSPIQLRKIDQTVAYESSDWPKSEEALEASIIAWYGLRTSDGDVGLHIFTNHDMKTVYAELDQTRFFVIVIAIFITLIAGICVILYLRKTTLLPIRKLLAHIHLITTNKEHLDKQVTIHGVPEVTELATGFNNMTTALKDLYQDLTDSYEQLESEINERNQAVYSNKAKSEFLSRMSHELRTPLNAILGFTELIMLDTDNRLESEQKEQLAYVYNAGEHLLSLVNELLDLESIESGKLYVSSEAVEVNSIIEAVLPLIKPAASAQNIKLTFKQEGQESLIVNADPARLKQVLINLMSNAVKFNRPNGEITIDITPASNHMYKFSIIDTGSGLTQEEQKQLFIPFNRVGKDVNTVEGTGIGLTIIKRLVELMGGEVGVDSVAGEGSTFWFTLKILEESDEGTSSAMLG
ncbi:MAG: HAMP domain-containing protein [Gammaproteobacteria bacterium]|nr:HAMP domain-containing protein [Gammaproteobacteria bacterium]MCK5090933.1 HAMP domain-containing protein [Gammaproteobacteria bacterium]